MVGDASVGKTSLTIRFISGSFLEDLKLTIGVDFYSKITLFKEKRVKYQIWDFGGEQRFRFLLPQYCRGANAAFYLYDITKPVTLNHLPDWTNIIREHAGDIPIILIGSKVDLEKYRGIPREEGLRAKEKYNLASFLELSSKTGKNVEKAFRIMTKILFKKYVYVDRGEF